MNGRSGNKWLFAILQNLTTNPAQTMVTSFLVLILAGTMLLMMSFTTADGTQLGFINAFFTATSAVCVTGLIVVDTATKFSIIGKIVILILIQFGGLGIMMFTYCTAYLLGRKISLKEKLALSYMLNENDLQLLSKSILKIIFTTLTIELIGAFLLIVPFYKHFGLSWKTFFYSVFHSISAFCNAGFALFSNSLEGFKSDSLLIIAIACLIILGGISFPVIMNVYQHTKEQINYKIRKLQTPRPSLTMNTKAVLVITFILIILGTIIFYGLEHKDNLVQHSLKAQYLSAFFQSVTLRTAGFNSLDLTHLKTPTYLIMLLFMFIGAAAGSTAGGIKVNTIAVIYAYIKAIFKNRFSVILYGHFLPKYVVSKALLIVLLASIAIFTGTLLLSITENFTFMDILFETVSAFGTVGLSTGITPSLTALGKIIITTMMFLGRLGPLTIMAAFVAKTKFQAKYPEGYINLG